MPALLIDLDGVLYQGEEAVPGAPEIVRWLTEQAIPHLFVTNTSSRPRRALVEKLTRLGMPVSAERILTPPIAARQWLSAHAPGTAALFMPPATREDFPGVRVLDETAEEGAASVVIGDCGEAWNFALLNRAFRLLMTEPRPVLVALGMTRYWRAADGLRLDVAPFVKALEHATGCAATVIGKPSKAFLETALAMLRCDAHDAISIGDDIVADVESAQQVGIRGLLVRTGKFRERDLEGGIRPDEVLDSIARLPELLGRTEEINE